MRASCCNLEVSAAFKDVAQRGCSVALMRLRIVVPILLALLGCSEPTNPVQHGIERVPFDGRSAHAPKGQL